MSSKATRIREGGTMVIVDVKTESAVIDYEEILEAVEIVSDDEFSRTPRDDDDYFEHVAITGRRLEAWKYDGNADVEEMQGYVRGNREDYLIRLTNDDIDGLFEYLRARGASRQTAREAVAAAKRNRLDTITKWYSQGWEYFRVTCEFRGYHASLWGIDDYDYADDEVRFDIAAEIAAELERDGYTVENKPAAEKRFKNGFTVDGFKAHLKRQLSLGNWQED